MKVKGGKAKDQVSLLYKSPVTDKLVRADSGGAEGTLSSVSQNETTAILS